MIPTHTMSKLKRNNRFFIILLLILILGISVFSIDQTKTYKSKAAESIPYSSSDLGSQGAAVPTEKNIVPTIPEEKHFVVKAGEGGEWIYDIPGVQTNTTDTNQNHASNPECPPFPGCPPEGSGLPWNSCWGDARIKCPQPSKPTPVVSTPRPEEKSSYVADSGGHTETRIINSLTIEISPTPVPEPTKAEQKSIVATILQPFTDLLNFFFKKD